MTDDSTPPPAMQEAAPQLTEEQVRTRLHAAGAFFSAVHEQREFISQASTDNHPRRRRGQRKGAQRDHTEHQTKPTGTYLWSLVLSGGVWCDSFNEAKEGAHLINEQIVALLADEIEALTRDCMEQATDAPLLPDQLSTLTHCVQVRDEYLSPFVAVMGFQIGPLSRPAVQFAGDGAKQRAETFAVEVNKVMRQVADPIQIRLQSLWYKMAGLRI